MGVLDMLKKQNTVERLPIELIYPNRFQPRKSFGEKELSELAESIKENGLIQPVSVRRTEGGYELIAGERRLRACKLIGRKTIEAIVYDIDDKDCAVWALIENLKRSDLGVFDEAEGMEKIISLWGAGNEEAAKKLGIAPSTLSNKLRILKLPSEAKRLITENGLTERHARELLRIESDEDKIKALRHIVGRKLNVSETERYINSLCAKNKEKRKTKYFVKDVRLFINTFEHAVDVMNDSGIGAEMNVAECGDSIVCSVSIPKSAAYCRRDKPKEAAPAQSAYAPSVI